MAPIIEGPWVPGFAAPASEDNPPCGEAGHHCVYKGVYRPEWVQIYIDEKEGDSSEVHCPRTHGDPWTVRRGRWIDVPMDVVNTVSSAFFEVSPMPTGDDGLKNSGESEPNRRVPRFSYRTIPSA